MDEIEIKTPFISLQTDFGFKRAFGSIEHKEALIVFLNALFEGKLIVNDVKYHDKEILPSDEKGKRIVYDVYCTTLIKRTDSPYFPDRQAENGMGETTADHHFILEMQNIYTPPFEERIVYYISKMVAGQGKAGWDYVLDPVFAVAVTDFNFSHLSPKMVRDVILTDRDNGEILTDKVHILLCSLKEIPKNWEECKTRMQQVLFLIKNMENMDNTSLAYREGNYAVIFEAAKSNSLREDEKVAYSQSLEKLRDTQLGIQYAAEQAAKQASAKAHAEGRAEGRAEEKLNIARNMLTKGMEKEDIALLTGLTLSEIENI